MPQISVVIPVYKVENFLSTCLDSLLAQSFEDWEAICVDDGSPDNCGRILDEHAAKDSRFKIIHQQNGGLSVARNAAYPLISAPYTIFVDSDDYLHKRALELMLEVAEKTACDMLWFDARSVAFDQNKADYELSQNVSLRTYGRPLAFYALKKKRLFRRGGKMPGAVWCKMYRSDLVKQIPFAAGISPYEDNLFTLEMAAKVSRLVYLPQQLYCYRTNPDSIMHTLNPDKVKKNMRRVVEYCIGLSEKAGELPSEKRHIMQKHLVTTIFFNMLFRPFLKGGGEI